ncbi:MAG: carbamoyl phosphate synthase large subunit [Alphaproteobacteria bacterium CG11_big_fil_rev_8_21_14_0_20_44_7]|nr:MAG: carbamoyl phosphate synthase large subunit [Alphaproteobacteria bacterium CG11_big_fil_rev_8_21_14_0_20_44_7]
MPKRTDIKTILIIGAGPIVIGQACEFDYSGTQAVKALKEDGYRIILLNSNPATIMTDPELADATYIEPITPEIVEKIIIKEKPDALLPTMGGQTALNTALAVYKSGVLDKHGVQLIGASEEAIEKAEDRDLFKQAMEKIGLDMPRSGVAHSMEEAREILKDIGLPMIIRPSFTMGGQGGGLAYNIEEFEEIVASGLDASPTTEVLIEESIVGWKEYEMEVVRDKNDNCIIICSIENIDPMGVHTGDSITVAPALTLTDKEYQIMRNASLAVLREIGVETGGSNVQFAVNPVDGRMIVIEMNPRVSRSSALASKATGFPIAKVAAKLAVGYTLDEIANDVTGGKTPASFEPTIDYIVVKIPRFTFEKFAGAKVELGSSMKSVGEAMAIGRSFPEALQKALTSMETGYTGLDSPKKMNIEEIKQALAKMTPDRILVIGEALRMGIPVQEICQLSGFDPWFVEQLQEIVSFESKVENFDKNTLLKYKKLGFTDAKIAELSGKSELEIRALRHKLGVRPVYKRVDSCAAEFAASTAYMYSAYEGDGINQPDCEAEVSDKRKVIILGGGPNRIGQGIEFDYTCVHAAYALKEMGIEAIMVNCNPETVSTDYDTSDRLYFEPLTAEHVIEICKKEMERGELLGVIVQFGGQTPLKLSHALLEAEIPIIGTQPDAIDLAEDRDLFRKLLDKLELKQPKSDIAFKEDEVIKKAESIGYPVLVRPSYVLGGRAMAIIADSTELQSWIDEMQIQFKGKLFASPVLVDMYLKNATELDVDCLCDGKDVFVAGIMEHIEEAGIHSGDSACSLPPYSLSDKVIAEVREETEKLALALGVVGLMNVQYAVKDGEIYVIEVNPRASRTVPFVAKTIGVQIAKIATKIMAGEALASFKLKHKKLKHVAVKEAVFPFARFPGVDTVLGPEMKSTGEAMGIDRDFGMAFAKSQISAGNHLPMQGNVFLSVKEEDKKSAVDIGKRLSKLGYGIVATHGTAKALEAAKVTVRHINKVREGRPHIVDIMKNGEIHLVLNTTDGAKALADSFSIRSTALTQKIPYTTTITGALAITQAIEAMKKADMKPTPLQNYG